MKKIFDFFSWLVVVILFLGVLVCIYWQLYPYKILEFKQGNGNILNENKTVKSGDLIRLRQVQCKYLDIGATINRQFIDTLVYQVNTVMTHRPLGCHDSVELVRVPVVLPSGSYRIRTTISYNVNPIRTVSYTIVTEQFNIINNIP